MVKVDFENIQCLKKGTIEFEENKLNIKFGYNGFGKSSISKGLSSFINNEDMTYLTPFNSGTPIVNTSKTFNTCLVYNNHFIDEYLFEEDDINSQCFNIVLKNSAAEAKIKDIEKKTDELKKSIAASLSKMVDDFAKISPNIRFTGSKDFAGNCLVGKGFKNGADLISKASIPTLSKYNDLFALPNSPSWIDWFKNGKQYIVANHCPYCKDELGSDFIKNVSDPIDNLFKDVDFKKNVQAKETLVNLSNYSSGTIKADILAINTHETITSTDKTNVKQLFDKLANEVAKIENIQKIESISLTKKNVKKDIEDFIKACKLDTSFYKGLGVSINNEVKNVNKSLDNLLLAIDDYINLLKEFDEFLVNSINDSNSEINSILKIAGIPYEFIIDKDTDNNAVVVIKSISSKNEVEQVKEHLSFGERNAFSLIIFGLLAKKQENDLLILDDPVSSFDENKKYALMHYLFNKDNGALKDETVLYFTHDLEPIIDFCYASANLIKPEISYLYLDGINVKEKQIDKSDLVCSMAYEHEQAETNNELLFKLIHLRRYYELTGIDHHSGVYEVLSNAEKLRSPMKHFNGALLEQSLVDDGINKIKEVIPSFDYDSFIGIYDDAKLLSLYHDDTKLDNERLAVSRLIIDKYKNSIFVDDTIYNFITKQYHIENMYIYSIKDVYNMPKYIFSILDQIISDIETIIGGTVA